MGPLDRRAFLRLATRGRDRVLEVSCERLYMRWVDAPTEVRPTDLAQAFDWVDEPGEPPAYFAIETRAELLRQLDVSLAGAQTVRLLEPEWLAHEDLRREVNARIAEFRRRGGRVSSGGHAGGSVPWKALAAFALLSLGLAAPVSAQASPDDALRARVEAALASAADLPADSLAVSVARGVVTVTGSVLCDGCGGNATPGGAGTVQQSLGAVVRAVPGVVDVSFVLRYRPR